MTKTKIIIPLLLLAACSKSGIFNDVPQEQSRACKGFNESKPEWIIQHNSTPMQSESGFVYFMGQQEARNIDVNRSQLIRSAENDARDKAAALIETRLQSIFQNVQEGYQNSNSQTQYVSTETRNIVLKNAITAEQYCEDVMQPIGLLNKYSSTPNYFGQNTEYEYKQRIYVRVKISESQIRDYGRKEIEKTISKDLQNKANNLWEKSISEM
ncbi:MAG: hypothetical protein LBL46_02930 [Rickettsiales bacterium]|jgi:hypothetical protein|nr:hypothetical protein [Rickettsiales bacterium]